MDQDVVKALDQFINNYVSAAEKSANALTVEYDPAWPSECCVVADDSVHEVCWQPKLRSDKADFSGLEKALELTIHSDLKLFYGRYWSDNLNAQSAKGALQLLQAWNLEDFERLQQNLVGHILMKRRLKQAETLFFAVTDEEDFILTLNNATGEVLLEQVGLKSNNILAPSLAEFIQSLEPDLPASE
ncbi:SecY-interacting protein [Paraglaciecola sp. L3A3]|uniref:SecY-interacting protein n=1 Tax=Paraglaciecola sp. L3A3 TaxID=2686358 RepID=UPI00131A8A97|nr:SecY-interacting protein [Paraglaciecola sp. L3A3]